MINKITWFRTWIASLCFYDVAPILYSSKVHVNYKVSILNTLICNRIRKFILCCMCGDWRLINYHPRLIFKKDKCVHPVISKNNSKKNGNHIENRSSGLSSLVNLPSISKFVTKHQSDSFSIWLWIASLLSGFVEDTYVHMPRIQIASLFVMLLQYFIQSSWYKSENCFCESYRISLNTWILR